jgi:hypothetical protein
MHRKRIEGIPVFDDRSRYKAPVEWVGDADRKCPRDREGLKIEIIGEFDARARGVSASTRRTSSSSKGSGGEVFGQGLHGIGSSGHLRRQQIVEQRQRRSHCRSADFVLASLAELMPRNAIMAIACGHRYIDKPDRIAVLIGFGPRNARDCDNEVGGTAG